MVIMFYIEGTICEANKPDCENDLLTPSDIQTLFNHSKPLKFDINHNTQALDGILILDNYLNDVGDWCIKLISDNEHLNQQLDSGEITGFSLSSSLDTHVCSINACVGECQYKDYDIGCWQPEYCSFVTHPCNRLGFNICEELEGGINIDLISKLKDLISNYEEETKVETNKFSKGLVENHNPASEEPEEVVEEVATEEPEAKPESTESEPEVEAEEEAPAEEVSEEVADAESEEVPEEDNDEVVEVEKSAKKEEAKEDNGLSDKHIKAIAKALMEDDEFGELLYDRIFAVINEEDNEESESKKEDKPKDNKKEDDDKKEDKESEPKDDKKEDNDESESKSDEDGEEDKPKTKKACKCAKSRTTKVSLGAEVSKSEYNKYDLYKSTGRDATGRKI